MSLKIFLRSPDTFGERRFDSETTIETLKYKLETITGIPSAYQKLALYHDVESAEALGSPISLMEDGSKTLRDYGVQEWQCIDVANTDPSARAGGDYTDVSQVEKFELTQEQYEKRTDTVLQDLKSRSLGRFAPTASSIPPTAVEHVHKPDQVVGARCILLSETAPHVTETTDRRGRIAFVGPTTFGDGVGEWIGVELDEPTGKNNGTVAGTTYFACATARGIFVRPERVQVGNYPEIDEFADMMDSEDEL